ncbi:hypothetical protein E6H18_00730 [Candidatus Bathyarchaeota archaeon]|nr:MAG: hypothetical protein E6H18_00730 [Candidatus Bathyarchaeota archaeon]
MEDLKSAVDVIERELIRGRARWVADLTEFFRDYRVMDATFSLYARGKTRNRGLFLSRFFASTVLPNYAVSLLCADESGKGALTTEKIRQRADLVFRIISAGNLRWAWLIILTNSRLTPTVVSFIERYDRRELGIGIADVSSKQAVFSNNQVGRSIRSRLGLEKLLGGLTNGEAN